MIDAPQELRFALALGYLPILDARIGGRDARVLIDTAAGLDLVSRSLAERLELPNEGRLTAQRCTGEELPLALTTLPTLEVGPLRREGLRVGMTDLLDRLPDEVGSVDAALSLKFFEEQPFTLDYAARTLTLETEESLTERGSRASVVQAEPREIEDRTLDLFVPVLVEGEHELVFEVDTGNSRALISDDWMDRIGISREGEDVRRVDGIDGHGNPFEAWYARVGSLALQEVPELHQADLEACFKPLIHDGVLGADFLRRFVVTFDVAARNLVLEPQPEEDSDDDLQVEMGAGAQE